MIQQSEAEISRAVINFLEEYRRHKKLSFFVNLEGARRDKRQQIAAKRHGMRAGRPDLEIVLPDGKIIWIELKRFKGGKLTPLQKETHKELSQLGHDVRTIYALDAVSAIKSTHKILCEYGMV